MKSVEGLEVIDGLRIYDCSRRAPKVFAIQQQLESFHIAGCCPLLASVV
jgi:hypothetical protein